MSYSNRILTDSGYQSIIRDKLGLDSITLPDEKIDRVDGVEHSEIIITNRVTDYASLTGDDLHYLKIATIFCVCAVLANDFGQGNLKSEKLPDYQYENFQVDMKEKVKNFWDKVEENLAQISTYTYPAKEPLEFLEGHTESSEETEGTSSPY